MFELCLRNADNIFSQGFLMDPQMKTNIADEVKDKKDLLRKQLAWNSGNH